MLENLKEALDKGLITGILLTDLTKAFDCIPHDILIAKLEAYGFSKKSLKLVYDYPSGRKQRTKVKNSYSTWIDIIYGVPRSSVLGPLLFNVYINDLFFSEEFQVANFADDCTPFDFGNNTDEVLNKQEEQSILLIEWYKYNYLKPNPVKWHLILSERGSNSYLNINGVYFDNKLNFDYHIDKLCKKASQKLHALARVSFFMSCRQKKQIMNAFITSQCGYCPLIWMFHHRKMLKQINRFHERAVGIVCADNNSSFLESRVLLACTTETYNKWP